MCGFSQGNKLHSSATKKKKIAKIVWYDQGKTDPGITALGYAAGPRILWFLFMSHFQKYEADPNNK